MSLLKTAKRNYYIKLFTNFKTNTKNLWQAINTLTKNRTTRAKINNIIINNKNLTNPPDIAEAFNNFFTNAASELDQKLDKPDIDPCSYLSPRIPQSMQIPRTNTSEVLKIIHSLKKRNVM